MKKIVITGATGFIGVHLIKEWLQDDVELYAIIRPNSKNRKYIPITNNVHIVECEMSDYRLLINRIKYANYFYHLAWEGVRTPYRDDEIIQRNNYKCSIEAIKVAKALGCTFFFGSGSQAEYGLTNGIVDEEYPCNPNTAYGKEKLNTYNDLKKLAKEYAMKFIWARIFSIYGPLDYPDTIIMSSLKKMKNNEPIEMTSGTHFWDYLYVEDAARAMRRFAIVDCDSGIYIMASGNYKPLNQFIISMKEIIGSQSELRFGIVPYGLNEPISLTPCIKKIKKALCWSPNISFETGISKMIRK